MVIRIIREPMSATTTFGTMMLDGFWIGHTLENSKKIIPSGLYGIKFYPSPKRQGKIVPLLLNVPGRDFIEIHPANYFHELEGCIAPGITRTDLAIFDSNAAFDKLMKRILGHSDVMIKIEDWS